MVALAAPVWSHTHNHKRKHRHARRACQETQTAEAVAAYEAPVVEVVQETQVVDTFVTVTIYETPAAETVQTTEQAETLVTVTVYETPVAEAVQTTQQPQTLVTVTVSETPAVEAVQTTQTTQTTQEAQTIATVATTSAAEAVETIQEAQATSTYAVATSQSTASAATTTAKAPGRALWLWQSNIIQDDDEVAQFLSFAESNEIKSVYALIDRDMGDAVFQSFISQCNSSGIAVEALMGNSQWILGLGDPTLESQLEWLEQYQGNASASSQFAGIHLDVEVREYYPRAT